MLEFFSKEFLEEKLLSKREIDQETGCWIYTGWWHPSGYGMMKVCKKSDKSTPAHVVAAHIWLNVPFFSNYIVAHDKNKCDCRACFNPEHLKVFENRKKYAAWCKRSPHQASGDRASRSGMSIEQALDVRDAIKAGDETLAEIARRIGITADQVYHIKARTSRPYIWEKGFDKKYYSGKLNRRFLKPKGNFDEQELGKAASD